MNQSDWFHLRSDHPPPAPTYLGCSSWLQPCNPSPCPLLCTWYLSRDTWQGILTTCFWTHTAASAFNAHPSCPHELLKNPSNLSPPLGSPPGRSQKLLYPGLIVCFVHICGNWTHLRKWLVWGTCLSSDLWTSQGQGQCKKCGHFHPSITDSER